jgi:hypothetical protein
MAWSSGKNPAHRIEKTEKISIFPNLQQFGRVYHVKFANMRNFLGNNHIFLQKKRTQKSKNA